ncbi:hypothetical protein GCM10027446_23060 [Angustibacter peucedani]
MRVVVEVADLASDGARAVVSAAVQLFSAADPVDVVLHVSGSDEPTQEQAEVVLGWCLGAVDQPSELPEVLLVGTAEATAEPAAVTVRAEADVPAAARAVALLTAAAQTVWAAAEPPAPVVHEAAPVAAQADPVAGGRAAARLARVTALEALARRDVTSAVQVAQGRRRPTVVGLFQHVSYWAAVEDVYRELAARDDVDFVPVALESVVDRRSGSTQEFLRENGFDPRPETWLIQGMDDVDAVVLENPYDEMRPWQLRVEDFARRGVRMVGLPYGNNAISGQFMDALLWDQPLHRLAWRYYLPNSTQRELYAQHCAAGDDPVRVLGNPKHDAIVRAARAGAGAEPSPNAAAWLELAAGRPVVVWNPHFRTAPGGWSTFPRYLRQVVAYAQDHDDLVLVVRPHFRLFSELRRGGLGHLERELRAAVLAIPNLVLDETPDYRDALGVADAMVSDLSSLASEFLVTGRPLLYLHRADGPGPSAEGGYLDAADRAESWPDVGRFLDQVRAGTDASADERRAAVARAFPFLDGGSARRVVDDLVRSLLADLAVAAPVEDADVAPAELPAVPTGLIAMPAPDATSVSTARSRPPLDAVLLTAFHGRSMTDNPLAIARELQRVGHQARRHWVVATPGAPVPEGCEPVLQGSAEHVDLLARARWVVDNDATPAALVRRPGQSVLQTWHGTPLKKLRFDLHEISPRSDATLRDLDHQARQWTHVVSPNDLTSTVLRRGFHVEGELLETGYPRNDVLADPARRDETRAAVRERLGVRDGQRVVLYAPTWRDENVLDVAGGATLHGQPTLDWAGIRSVLGEGTVCWVRAHRFVAGSAAALGGAGVVDVSAYPDMADLLAAADVLVTDYSSCFFDFAITGRPMVFFTPDLERYRTQRRGHYFRMEEVVPGPVLLDAHRVTEALATVDAWSPQQADRYRSFVQTFAPWDDGKAAQRVVEAVFA